MAIIVTLSPELEAQLRDRAIRKGQDVNLLASELLTNFLEWEAQDSEEAIEAIQQGLENFAAGQFRSFDESKGMTSELSRGQFTETLPE
ncbi:MULTISPECIES: hypothetical protein [Kamptonema]|uniref:hypothetical protein n=1 Tax=Kamptonema TaxID=1501433 RepID=UPI0001DAD08E|nr:MULTISPECIES: hypothetical protein [Kamptonema]CBN57039.1 conserved hypothetical protein [Kamptonema sp. PCC 6506]